MDVTVAYPVLGVLEQGCAKLSLPSDAALELVRWWTIKKLVGAEEGKKISPSTKLDDLQHWVLLNTKIRKTVELQLGELHHSTSTESLDDATKCRRR